MTRDLFTRNLTPIVALARIAQYDKALLDAVRVCRVSVESGAVIIATPDDDNYRRNLVGKAFLLSQVVEHPVRIIVEGLPNAA